MLEIAIMLLPVAAASGWYVASRHYKAQSKLPQNENSGYFKGLNYLLNEQPDKAIDVFVNLLEVDDETIEIHLALGTLFRQRGEVEKSIRLHQNLIARPQLNQEMRLNVLSELGLDYMRAGLLDRAENIFLELEGTQQYKIIATKKLLSIFQQEQEWLKAIEYTVKLESFERRKRPTLLSHLHCEVAESFNKHGDTVEAKSHLDKALRIDPLCVRANVISAQIDIKNGDYKQALKRLMKIPKQDTRFVPVFLELIISCFDELNQPKQKFKFLADLQADNHSAIVYGSFVDVLIEQKGLKQAEAFMREKLRNEPKESYLRLYANIGFTDDLAEESRFLKEVIHELDETPLSFQCNHCGFNSVEINWCCPGCKEWGVTEPILV